MTQFSSRLIQQRLFAHLLNGSFIAVFTP